jgi:hypothetical protein
MHKSRASQGESRYYNQLWTHIIRFNASGKSGTLPLEAGLKRKVYI